MDIFTSQFSISCVLGVLSFTLYVTTILILHYYRPIFSGSFFILYKAGFWINFVTFFNSFVSLRVPQNTCLNCSLAPLLLSHSRENLTSFPLCLFYGTQLHMGFLQYLLALLISANRFTMFIWLNENDRRWRVLSPFVLLLILCTPLIATWRIYTSDCYFVYLESIGGFATRSEYSFIPTLTILVNTMTVSTCLSAFFNIASVFYLSKLGSRIKSAEKRLLYVSILSFLIELFCLAISNLVNYHTSFPSWLGGLILTLVPYSSDMLTLSQPWILIVCSSAMREKIADIFRVAHVGSEVNSNVSTSLRLHHSLAKITH